MSMSKNKKLWPRLKAGEPQRGENLLLINRTPGVPRAHLIDFGRLKG